jgi:hypothetical protein
LGALGFDAAPLDGTPAALSAAAVSDGASAAVRVANGAE